LAGEQKTCRAAAIEYAENALNGLQGIITVVYGADIGQRVHNTIELLARKQKEKLGRWFELADEMCVSRSYNEITNYLGGSSSNIIYCWA